MVNRVFDDYDFQHFIDFPNCECVYCSTKERSTGRTRLFLVFNEKRRIYMHNGKKDTWDELQDDHFYEHMKAGFNEAVTSERVPCFTTLAEHIERFNLDQLF